MRFAGHGGEKVIDRKVVRRRTEHEGRCGRGGRHMTDVRKSGGAKKRE